METGNLHTQEPAEEQELSVHAVAERLRSAGVLHDAESKRGAVHGGKSVAAGDSIGKQMDDEMDKVKGVVSEEHKEGLKERLKRNKEDLFLFSAILDPKWQEL